jgi:transposase
VKSARERLDIVNAYAELGSYRAAAELCGTTHKTVRRVVERQRAGTLGRPTRPPRRPRNTDQVTDLIARRIKQTDGRISAKRLLPEAQAGGYRGRRGTSAARSPRSGPTGAAGGGATDRGCPSQGSTW